MTDLLFRYDEEFRKKELMMKTIKTLQKENNEMQLEINHFEETVKPQVCKRRRRCRCRCRCRRRCRRRSASANILCDSMG